MSKTIELTKDKVKEAEFNLHRMMYTSQMMRNLMLDLLDLAQMENNTLKINNDYFNLKFLIEKAFIIVDHIAKTKNVKLIRIIQDTNEKKFAKIFGDERRFQQILVNFLSNALKFSNKNSEIIVCLSIIECIAMNHKIRRMGVKQLKSQTEIVKGNESLTNSREKQFNKDSHYITFNLTVQDFGYGMSPQSLSKLFIDFNKMEEGESMNINGVGLGLSICKNLIE